MDFANINYLAVGAAAISSMIIGSLWYGILAKRWMSEAGINPDDYDEKPAQYIISLFTQLLMAWMLAGILDHLGMMSMMGGLNMAAFLWLGFVMTTITVNHRFQGSSWSLTLINCGHWLVVLMVMGGIIGWMGS